MENAVVSGSRAYALAVFIALWVVVGWKDWWHQKIRHRDLAWGLAGTVLGYAALGVNTALGLGGWVGRYHTGAFYAATASSAGLCVLAAAALWMLRVWPAGDAKLFMTLSLLYPIMHRAPAFPRESLFLNLLINIFLPAAAALTARAAVYIFDTRLRHGREFLLQLGWRRELDFLLQGMRRSAAQALAAALAWGRALRDSAPGEAARSLLDKARGLAGNVGQWIIGMAFMALISYYLKDFMSSPFLLSLLCMGLFILYTQLSQRVGRWPMRALLIGLGGAFLLWRPPTDTARLLGLFGNVTVFGFCMFLGMSWCTQLVSGGMGSLVGYLMPLLLTGVLYVFYQFARLAHDAWRWAAGGLREAGSLARGLTLPDPTPSLEPAATAVHGVLASAPWVPADWKPGLAMAADMAVLGLFFGLGLVLVRRWDEEVRPSHRREALAAGLLVDPAFLARIEDEDPDFYAATFGSVYADGLTPEQAQALRGWCAERSLEAVPLAPTISFASWIFMGFLVTLLLGGGHVVEIIL